MFQKRQTRRTAKLFLKKRELWTVNGVYLDRELAQYRVHGAWMGARIDPAWIARIERKRKRAIKRGLIFTWIFAALIVVDIVYVFGKAFITGSWN